MTPLRPLLVACVLVLCAAASAVLAQPAAWRVDRDATQVHWEVAHFGTSTARGRFDRFRVDLALDLAARRGSLAVTVDTASVSSGLGVFDRVLKSGDMLDTTNHPNAWFVAKRIDFDAQGRPAAVRGELTLRGRSGPLVLQVKRFVCGGEAGSVCAADLEGELTRSDYGITHALPFADNRVRLVVYATATPAR